MSREEQERKIKATQEAEFLACLLYDHLRYSGLTVFQHERNSNYDGLEIKWRRTV